MKNSSKIEKTIIKYRVFIMTTSISTNSISSYISLLLDF